MIYRSEINYNAFFDSEVVYFGIKERLLGDCVAKILLVDDDEFYRGALKGTLVQLGHEVTDVDNAKEAQDTLRLFVFDVVISDIRMPEMSGIQLLQWIKSDIKIQVVLITGFSEILDTKSAAELGADDFLLKPFQTSDIKECLEKLLTKNARESTPVAPTEVDLDDHYCKVPLEDFVTGSRIHFSIFLRISKSKYLKIGYQGEDVSLERIRSYTARGIKHLYLLKEDFAKYVGFSLTLAKKLKFVSQISPEKKRNFIRYTGELILERVFTPGADQEEFEIAQDFVNTTLGIVQEDDEAFLLLESLNSHGDFLYAHSLGVSLYGVMIAKEMNWHSTPTLFKISLSGLLHDIGLKEIPREILEKSRAAMSQQERSLYETHTARGMELLNGVKAASGDVILVAYQHHEDWSGCGYPKKLTRSKIHPLSLLLSVADAFCEQTIQGPGREKLPALTAIHQMISFQGNTFAPEPFEALKRVFKFDALAEATTKIEK
jgi:response regulator RpfG family c-di-GMP phosphodiesterase